MSKTTTTSKATAKPGKASNGKAKPGVKRPASKNLATKKVGSGLLWMGLEALAWLSCAVLSSMLALGYAANWFNGSDFFANLLPFAIGVGLWIMAVAVLLLAWRRFRQYLLRWARPLPATLAIGLAVAVGWYAAHDGYASVFTDFRALVGGKQQAARTTLAHQVFAAYRRYDQADLQSMINRAQNYNSDITDAAAGFNLDLDIMLGVAAAESSFLPRDSKDGGHGLFQITDVPKFLLEQARKQLAVEKLSVLDHRHNAFIAAATLKHYLAEMHGDLFLGLLAYNIGPRNGGLKFIMQQYGAGDFVSMQPYLQQLPRDYPIRVLSYALAFRLWHNEGKLLAYQEGDNALRIQRLGIPGLPGVF